MQGAQNSTTKLEGKVQIPGSHARSFTTTVAEMKASIQITSTRPMLSVIVGLFDPQIVIITFSSATPYTFTSQFSSKEARYSNLHSFSAFQLHGHPSDVTLDLVVTSRVGETLAPMQLRANSVTKIGAPNPKPDHCQHKPDCLNPNGSLDPSSQTLVSSIGVPNGRCFYMFNWTSEVPSVF